MGAKVAKRGGYKPKMYTPENVAKAIQMVEEFAATEDQLGRILGVSRFTIRNWREKKPEFKKALQAAKDVYNSRHGENALVKRALGYEWTQQKTTIEKGVKKTTVTTIHVPPDPTCLKFLLTNRSSDRWRNTIDVAHDHLHQGVILVGQVSKSGDDWSNKFGALTHPPIEDIEPANNETKTA